MGGKSNLGGIERRTVVRAGAWSVPVVAVAVAAPAYACSPFDSLGNLTFGATFRNRANASDPNGADPTRIDVTSTVKNNGTQSTGTFTRTLTIPAGVFDSVASSTPPLPATDGYAAPVVTPNPGGGWTIMYQRPALAAGATDDFSATLTVGNTTASPYRGWQGSAFTMNYTINGGATCNSFAGTFPLLPTVNTTLSLNGWAAIRRTTADELWIGGNTAGVAVTTVSNPGRKAVGPVTLTVTVPDSGNGNAPFDSVQDKPPVVNAGWVFLSRTSPGGKNTGPWVYTFQTNGDYLAPDALNGALTNHITPAFGATIYIGGTGALGGTRTITAAATAPGATATPSATSTDNAESSTG